MKEDHIFTIVVIAMLKSITPINYGQSELYKNDIYFGICTNEIHNYTTAKKQTDPQTKEAL